MARSRKQRSGCNFAGSSETRTWLVRATPVNSSNSIHFLATLSQTCACASPSVLRTNSAYLFSVADEPRPLCDFDGWPERDGEHGASRGAGRAVAESFLSAPIELDRFAKAKREIVAEAANGRARPLQKLAFEPVERYL